MMSSFNPRAREGRDYRIIIFSFAFKKFQSTRPRGARRCSASIVLHFVMVSIHASRRSRERDAQVYIVLHIRDGFNPRVPTQSGARCSGHIVLHIRDGFNPRVPTQSGARCSGHIVLHIRDGFNPRAREGRDVRCHDCACSYTR